MRIFVHMLGFNRPEMIRGALENYRDTTADTSDTEIVKCLFDCGYPLPSATSNTQELTQMAKEYGWEYKKIPNLGVAKNWQQAFEHFNPNDEDVIVGFDPDVRMQELGWLSAMVNILTRQHQDVFVCANRPFVAEEWCVKQYPRTEDEIGGESVLRFRGLIAWSMGAYSCGWIKNELGGQIDAHNKIYGYGEHWMFDRMKEHGKSWVMLRDYFDHHLGATDQLYTDWKVESAKVKTHVTFEEWLKEKGHVK